MRKQFSRSAMLVADLENLAAAKAVLTRRILPKSVRVRQVHAVDTIDQIMTDLAKELDSMGEQS